MILTHRSSAWLLVGLQAIFSILFTYYLVKLPTIGSFQLLGGPTWFTTLVFLSFGLVFLLALCALWKHELAILLLLFAMHLICPLLFFTDLTRNPYFTQIVLLNIWISFIWMVWFWECFKNQRIAFPKTILDSPLLIFFAVITLSWLFAFFTHEKSFFSSMFWEGIKRWLFTAINCIAVYYIAVTVEEKWRKRFIFTTFLVGGIAAVYGLMQFYGIEQIWKSALTPFGNRPVSTFGNPNFLSSYLLLLVPLTIVLLFTVQGNFSKFFLCALLLILLVGIIATMTRSTWVGTVTVLLLLPIQPAIRDSMKKNKTKIMILVAILIPLILFWPKSKLGGYESPWKRVMEIRDVWEKKEYQPWHQRMLIWSSCWKMVQEHILIGKGWGLLELFYPYYQGKALFQPLFRPFRTHANNAHNEMLEIWSQTGFLGMGVYVWFWVVIFFFGNRCAKFFAEVSPEKSLWAWAFTVGAAGMLADNFFGNVSIHFAVPAFLFWWQLGLLFSLPRRQNQVSKPSPLSPLDWHLIPVKNNLQKLLLCGLAGFFLASCIFNFRREFQEIYYFLGFKISKTSNYMEQAKQTLEEAWRWYPREVNNNYELANTYARLAYQAHQSGLAPQAEHWRKKAIWGYMESLRANCGYDEIYFNLGTVLSQLNWVEPDFPAFSLDSPRSLTQTEEPQEIGGAIYNFSRAIAINPLSQEAYHLLGSLFFQNRNRYGKDALHLYRQGAQFFPENKDIWVNLAFLYRENKNYTDAYQSIKKAVALDPFYELARNSLRAILSELNRTNDPLRQLDALLLQIPPLIQSRNWVELKKLAEQAVQILPDSFQLRFIFANTLFELKDWEKAENEYKEALKIYPKNVTAMHNLALSLRSQNKLAEAKKIYQKLLIVKPDDAHAQNQLKMLE